MFFGRSRSLVVRRTQKLPSSRSGGIIIVAADQGREIPDSRPRSVEAGGGSRGRGGVGERGCQAGGRAGGGENFSLAVARIKRLIVKATCAREPSGVVGEGRAVDDWFARGRGARRSVGGERRWRG